MTAEDIMLFEIELLELLKEVIDPEVEINIVDMGLIYKLTYDGEGIVNIDLTFSTPSCPLGDTIMTNIRETINQKYPDFIVSIELVFEPKWTPAMISDEGRKMLG
ncbi:MAG: FeS assembly SUF system protein SufT [Flavobacteriaceae bacterium]|nr:MAG: FeS assembly SUF system protein SufT [Flavobacteriaceae bacterium]